MRILVTGGSGFIGRHVVSQLAASGNQVRVIDLRLHRDPEVDLVQGDIADPVALAHAFDCGMDAVVHLAAVTSVLKSIEQPELTYSTNVEGTHRLLEAARQAGVTSLTFASTNAVTGPMQAPKIREDAVLNPLTPYGATKAAGEMLMSAYTASYGVRCVPIRLTNVYGPGMELKDSIIARLMRAILTGGHFEIYGDGTQVRDYVHAHDVVQAMELALTNEEWTSPVIIGSGISQSVLDVVDEVRTVTGAGDLDVGHGPAKAGEMPAVIVDNSRALAAGWKPQYPTLAEGLVGVWDEWRQAEIDESGNVVLPGAVG